MMEASFTATLDDLDSMIDHILCYAKALCFSKEQLFQIELAAEEAAAHGRVHDLRALLLRRHGDVRGGSDPWWGGYRGGLLH